MQTESRSPGQPQTAEACVRKGWVASPKALFVAEGVQGIKMGRSGEKNRMCIFNFCLFFLFYLYIYINIFVCV